VILESISKTEISLMGMRLFYLLLFHLTIFALLVTVGRYTLFKKYKFNFSIAFLIILALMLNSTVLLFLLHIQHIWVPALQMNWLGKIAATVTSLLFIYYSPEVTFQKVGLNLNFKKTFHYKTLFFLLLIFLFSLVDFYFDQTVPPFMQGHDAVLFEFILPGIEEEIFWRGLLLLLFAKLFQHASTKRAWFIATIATSLLFAAGHAVNYQAGHLVISFQPVFPIFIIGIILCIMRLLSGNLLLPIIVHNWLNTYGWIFSFY